MAKRKNGNLGSSDSGSRVDLTEINRVLVFMVEHGLDELEYESGDFRVRLKRQDAGGAGVTHHQSLAAPRGLPAVTPAPVPAESSVRAPAPAPPPEENLHTVKSPIVGTFYASPSPDAPPFVTVGDTVSRGQILCIIEAMKLMNEIEADHAGEIARVFVENGQPVEYGQPLFALRPA
ncbi:MAG TPA: acetyl-CoA carboxylase biotin carboxyl carrier protein [Patescibacteria group bacterium]|nr:acetyl-CoA carboxylase biotin carboxyl carrier protein [Patescibacteria group bacterium]